MSRTAYPSGAPDITLSIWWGSCCLVFSFLCCVFCTIICLFVFLFFSHGVVSLFSIYGFHSPSGIFRPSLVENINYHILSCLHIKLRREIGNVSKQQQPDHRADNSQRPSMGLQCSEKLSHPYASFSRPT